jgi:apolipoprotein N-acyltransferase
MSGRAGWLWSAFGGALLALAFPPFGLMLLSFVAIAPLLIAVRGLTYWQAFGRGYVFGLVFGLPNMFWLEQFVGRWTGSFLMACVPWLAVCLAFAVYFGLFAGAAAKAWERGWPWAIPLAWAGVEAFRSLIPFLFFPWSLLSASVWRLPWMLQPAWWGGPYLLSAWICLFNVLAAMVMTDGVRRPHSYLRYSIVGLGVLFSSIGSYMQPQTGQPVRLAAVQPGVDLAFLPDWQQKAQLGEKVPRALAAGQAVGLQVLPEGVSSWNHAPEPAAPFPLDFRSPTLMGGQRQTPSGTYQSMFAYDGKWQYADKTRLVIFGEYVPFRERLRFLEGFNLPGGDLRPGDGVKTLQVGGLRVGGLLCFEALFEEVARKHAANGAQVLAVMSLDDWYQETGAIDALRAGAVLRAVENRIPLVRSASLGPSMIIDARGNVVAQARPRETVSLQSTVLVPPSSTPSPLRTVLPGIGIAALVLLSLLRRRTVVP